MAPHAPDMLDEHRVTKSNANLQQALSQPADARPLLSSVIADVGLDRSVLRLLSGLRLVILHGGEDRILDLDNAPPSRNARSTTGYLLEASTEEVGELDREYRGSRHEATADVTDSESGCFSPSSFGQTGTTHSS